MGTRPPGIYLHYFHACFTLRHQAATVLLNKNYNFIWLCSCRMICTKNANFVEKKLMFHQNYNHKVASNQLPNINQSACLQFTCDTRKYKFCQLIKIRTCKIQRNKIMLWITHRVILDKVYRLFVTISYFRSDRFVQLLTLIPILTYSFIH